MIRKIVLLWVLFFISCHATADRTYIVINGVSKHYNITPYFKKIGLNERHDGLGIEREQDSGWFYAAGWLKDSLRNTQPYATVGKVYSKHYRWFEADFKINGFLSAREDQGHYGTPLFGILPSVVIGTASVKLEASYIPKFKVSDVSLVFVQLKIGI